MALPRMRGINEAIEEIKAEDKNSAVTIHFLRNLLKSGTIPCVRVGAKYLVNMEVLEEYLKDPSQFENNPRSGIRRIIE